MSRLSVWLRGSSQKPSENAASAVSRVDLRARSLALLNDALVGLDLIMNDNLEGAEARLGQGSSTYHLFGLAICAFIKTLAEVGEDGKPTEKNKAETARLLHACQTAARVDVKAEKETNSADSQTERLYPAGSEYQVLIAQSLILSAMIGLMNETMVEAIKGLHKIRKAYLMLAAIKQAEAEFLAKRGLAPPLPKGDVALASQNGPGDYVDDSDPTLSDADVSEFEKISSQYENILAHDNIDEAARDLSPDQSDRLGTTKSPSASPFLVTSRGGSDSDVYADPIDAFIHSATNMAFGISNLILSLTPPMFSQLLSVIGFKGDRERGLQMLWESTRFDNINGAMSAFMLFSLHHNHWGSAEILPSDADIEKGADMGYPKEQFAALLIRFRGRYPDSAIWKFEDARTREMTKDLTGAVRILMDNNPKIPALASQNHSELSIALTFAQEWSKARDYYIRCVDDNTGNPSINYYLAGCAELELYRNACLSDSQDESRNTTHRLNIEGFFQNCYNTMNQKYFTTRQLSLSAFVLRKLTKWQARSTALDIPYVDAIGVSPIQEFVYVMNGLKAMQPGELENVSRSLSWRRLTCSGDARFTILADAEERAVHDLCQGAILRNLGKYDEARATLQKVLQYNKSTLTGPTIDDYISPSAHYEMAVLMWVEKETKTPEETKKKVEECQSWLEKVDSWPRYPLDNRLSGRVQTALETLQWYNEQHAKSTR
ncbi:breast cancer protein [Xylaria sp. CBS 124048]|nr:breast cancer protein [Xylaria sp. CBS 124048]